MTRTTALLAMALAFAMDAKAAESFTDLKFTTGTSFELREIEKPLVVSYDDGDGTGHLYWRSQEAVGDPLTLSNATVSAYGTGERYDYAAKGTVRNALLEDKEPDAEKYLSFDISEPLDRLVMPLDETVSNVLVKTSEYDGIYADGLFKLLPSFAGPDLYSEDKIVVWMRESQQGETLVTNLMVSVGRYTGTTRAVEPVEYVITNKVSADTWCRITIRSIANVLSSSRLPAPGFVVYVDGQPAVADSDYDIGELVDFDKLTPEAHVLVAERRLFPWLGVTGKDRDQTLSRLSVSGQGAIDDIVFTSERPAHVVPDNVFTLNWDAGIKSFTCTVSNETSEIAQFAYDVQEGRQYRHDFGLGENSFTRVTVTNVVYDTANDYSNGVWTAEHDCYVTNGCTFVCENAEANPIGWMASSRKFIRMGTNTADGCTATFDEALSLMKTNDVKTLRLETDLLISNGKTGGSKPYDNGYLSVPTGQDVILDLNGHVLQGQNGSQPTVRHTGGTLRIIDSSKEQAGCVAAAPNGMSVQCGGEKESPELVICAGRYEGLVVITGKVMKTTVYGRGKCVIDGGTFTNAVPARPNFYLAQYVTNGAYYALNAQGYWAATTNGCVWCGEGSDARWSTAKNWCGETVPGSDDLAIFPATDAAWAVDFGTGVGVTKLWLDGDVAMSGTNVFTGVKVVSGTGRLVGTGTAAFAGSLPGNLMGAATEGGEIRLGSDWCGTVRIGGMGAATVLTDMGGWGKAGSKVAFNGVRGYVNGSASFPYELVLTDNGSTVAWDNESGSNGTVSFAKLSGTGTFASSGNDALSQIYKFVDVGDFTGKFRVTGKKLVLGSGDAAAGAAAGHATFSDGVRVRSGRDWESISAHFGSKLYVTGETNDVLMTVESETAEQIRNVTVYQTGRDGVTNTCWLTLDGSRIVVTNAPGVEQSKITLAGASVFAMDAGAAVCSGSVLSMSADSDVSISGNDILFGSRVASSIPSYYLVTENAGVYSVALNEAEVKPTLAEFSVVPNGGVAEIVVNNARSGLWYCIQTSTSLAAPNWATPDDAEWTQASEDGEALYLAVPAGGGTGCFYRVLVTDKVP